MERLERFLLHDISAARADDVVGDLQQTLRPPASPLAPPVRCAGISASSCGAAE